MATTTRFHAGDVARFKSATNDSDPYNGRHVVVTAINPAPLLFADHEHYRIYVPEIHGESYALAEELSPQGRRTK